MSTSTVPISDASRRILQELATRTGQTMADVLDRALQAYQRETFFQQLNAGYTALRADANALEEHQAELASWDATLMDGLDPRRALGRGWILLGI